MRKKRRILLVEPDYKSFYPPLGLMKISSWHKSKGDYTDFVKGKVFNNKRYDIIYITSLFTYYADEVIDTINFYKNIHRSATIKIGGILASLMPEYIKKKTGIYPHVGLLKTAENHSPDYSFFPNLSYSLTFTTRGCFRKCPYCAVNIHEPSFFVKENWEKDIDVRKSRIIFWDNNWFFSPNFFKDVEKLKRINKSFDFNQGLDARLFNAEKAKLLSGLKINPLRFSFDSIKDDGHVQKAIEIAKKFGINDIRVYVLYDFKDSPEDFYYRINAINKLGALSYPMRYRPIDIIDKNHIDKEWDKESLRAIKLILTFYYTKGMIRKDRVAFLNIFGPSQKGIRDKLHQIFLKDKEKSKASNKSISIEMGEINWEEMALVTA